MIGYLEGQVKYATTGKVTLFCNGIGFVINTPSNIAPLPKTNLELYIHTHIREDNLALFGFSTPEDLSLFETLISVNGVGPKTALTMFSTASAALIKDAISASNLNFFTAIPGVGKKTAQRLILDLKQKISKGDVNMDSLQGDSELVNSLLALGFQKKEISEIIPQIDSKETLPQQIKKALSLLKR